VKEPARENASTGSAHAFRRAEFLAVLKERNVWLGAIAASGFIAFLFLQSVFAPLYITKVMHQSPESAGSLLSALGFGAFAVAIVMSAVIDRLPRKKTLLALSLMCTVSALLLLVPSLYAVQPLLWVLLFVTAGQQGVSMLAMQLIPAESVPAGYIATAIGLVTGAGEIVGATVAPTVAGALADRYGLAITMWLAAGATLLIFFATLFMRETMTTVRETSAGELRGSRVMSPV
jgi:sugar phosphate permease